VSVSVGQLIVLLGAVGLLASGLLLWYLERKNPRLLARQWNGRFRRRGGTAVLAFLLVLAAASLLTPPPFGSRDQSPVLFAVAFGGIVVCIFAWLRIFKDRP